MPRSRVFLVSTVLVTALVVATAWALSAPASAKSAPKGDAFYKAEPSPDGKPGEVISTSPMKAPAGAKAWKVLYQSEAIDGTPIVVSGVIVAPNGKAPNGGRPVVTWAHGTTGLADGCAPSKKTNAALKLPAVKKLLKAGDVVVATDYQGLGTAGLHPYLVGESEGRGVLDIARAAVNLTKDTGASNDTIIYGHSQGGHAALFAGQIAKQYAPDLDVIGVAAGAPVGDLKLLLPVASQIPDYLGYLIMGGKGFAAAYPEVEAVLPTVLTPKALADSKIVDEKCSDAINKAFKRPPAEVVAKNPGDVPPFPDLLDRNTPGHSSIAAPLFVFQGTKDTLVLPFVTEAWAKRVCALGDTVDLQLYEGEDHGGSLDASVDDAVAWMADRVAGKDAPNNCGNLPTPSTEAPTPSSSPARPAAP